MLDPGFFLASLSKGWRPRVVAVYHGNEVVGIVYAKERIISFIPTGIVYVDEGLGGFLLGNPDHRQNSLQVAVEAFIDSPRIRGLRLRLRQGSDELVTVKRLIASRHLDAEFCHLVHNDSPLWKYHAHLPLTDNYEQFLNGLGKTTRHNFRYYRRRFETAGHHFVENLSVDELRSAALDLYLKCKYTGRSQQAEIKKGLDMVAAAHHPLAVGLKHFNGEWLSVIGGWYRPGAAVLRFQCNDNRDFGSDSLSVVLRAFLIEQLIRQGMTELSIWSDTAPPLSRYVTYVPMIGVRFDKSKFLSRLVHGLTSTVEPWLPKRLAASAKWID